MKSKIDPDAAQQSGITSRHMQESPQGAIYVWPHNNSIGYAIRLARHLGREDLKIIAPHALRREKVLGMRPLPVVVLDHATELTHEGWAVVEYLRERVSK